MSNTTAQHMPALATGRWSIDPAHSEVSFAVRHLMVSKVRGGFAAFTGELTIAEDPLAPSVVATIEAASVDTRQPDRDAHLRSEEFLDTGRYPAMHFRSTGVEPRHGGALVTGELTIRAVTRPIQLAVTLRGVTDAGGDLRAGFSATAQLDRREFGVGPSSPLEGGGLALGDRVDVEVEIQAVHEGDAA